MAYDKVIDSATLDAGMVATANAIREKTGQAGAIPWENDKGFSAAVAGIQVGGGGSGGTNPFDHAFSLRNVFGVAGLSFSEVTDIDVSFGDKVSGLYTDALSYVIYRNGKVRTLKISSGAPISAVSMNCFAEINAAESTLEKVDLTGAVGVIRPTNLAKAFYHRAGLREILGELDVSQCTTFANAFNGCLDLETVRFKAGTIKIEISFYASANLTDETIQNIIDGLADLSGGTAQTLTLHATVGAKLTDAQKAAASAKNWTISY